MKWMKEWQNQSGKLNVNVLYAGTKGKGILDEV